ncbi:hypothetical protein [Delftia sp. CH05]|uniref:hypothetical protein n=1 Tax=Delftia sp. CH05 TaxID=2692194 RepID=UPI00135E3ECF|nr:hypothetical protein [Delftia sp. CH05]MXN30191.1 hypothetical protein [Delftia sp. CH05]
MDSPSFRSQHMPVRPSQEHPFLGRDPLDHGCAIFTVIESLQQLGLEGRTARLLSWLGRFEGLERHLEEDSDPVLSVRQILLRHVADQPRCEVAQKGLADATWQSIVHTIVAQPFVHVCCDWSMDGLRPRIRWDPSEHTFLQFVGLGQAQEDLAVWSPAECISSRVRRFKAALQHRPL